jgi:hypothetical protein
LKKALRRLGRFEESLRRRQNALGGQQTLYDSDKLNVGDINSLADCHLERRPDFSESGNPRKAIEHFEKSIALYESLASTARISRFCGKSPLPAGIWATPS